MKNLKNKRVKLNNAGMSLVELLIAMAIMAVAIIPLLFAFVNMAKYNGRARELQQTTVLAQTVMENCKAYSYETIEGQILSTGTFLPGVSVTSADQVGTTFHMINVPLENQKYDVELQFTPRGINGDSTTSFDLIDTKSMNPYLDAVFTAQGSKTIVEDITAAECDHNAYLAAFEKISAAIALQTKNELGDANKVTLSTSYIENSFKDSTDPNYGSFSIKREIYIHLWPSGAVDRIDVTYRYTFLLNGGKYTYEYVDAAGDPKDYVWSYSGTENEIEYHFSIYNNYDYEDSAKVENVYFFYYPAYQGNLSMYPFISDYIQVSNDLKDETGNQREMNVYLIKQKNPAYTDTNLGILESNYQVSVKGWNSYGTDPKVNVYHNFDENLGDLSTTALSPGWFTNITTANTDYVDEYNVSDDTLMYDVNIKIYDAGSYNLGAHAYNAGVQPVLTMDGTALDW